MKKFTHIDAFYQVARYVHQTNADNECPDAYKVRGQVSFRGSVKLHGTNAGVRCTPEALIAQSRTRALSTQSDNYGFAAHIAQPAVTSALRSIEAEIRENASLESDTALTLFGEWVGPGVQRGVALNELPARQWVLFAACEGEGDEACYLDAVPTLGERFAKENVFAIVDAPLYELVVDFEDASSCAAALEEATQLTEAVEAKCPWASRFGIEGVGEGIVWVPVGEHWGKSDLYFKTKGAKHQNTKRRIKAPQLTPEILEGIDAFVEFAVTSNRLEQGLGAVVESGCVLEMKSMGSFLKWMAQDVQRECALELETNGLEWKQVAKAVARRSRDFFKEEVQRI